MHRKPRLHLLPTVALLALTTSAVPLRADPVADFYTGKTIDVYIGYTVGGTYDLYARLVAMFMGNHIPGKPKIIPRSMPGGGSRKAAMYVYSVAPQDGTAFGIADQALAVEQAQGDPTLQFDTTKFNWIGSPIAVNNTTTAWHAVGIKSIDDVKSREMTVGASGGSASSQYPKAMNAVLGTKFKIVYGYHGGPDINLAMERGEVDGRGSTDWISWKATKAEWLRDKKIIVLVQIGLRKEPDLPDVPLLMDLASNADDRSVLKLLSSGTSMGRPIFTSPGVPPERLQALRTAFDATVKDPAFLAEAAKQNLDINPVSGLALQQQVQDVLSTPRPIADRLLSIIGRPH